MAEKQKAPTKNSKLTIEELKKAHPLHEAFKEEWDFLYAAYEGTRELVNAGFLVRNERETPENYLKRKKQAYGFNYSQSIVDTLNFYLNKKPPKRTTPDKIDNDELYKLFSEDVDLESNGMDEFLTEQSRLASILGMVGILVDKAGVVLDSRQEQIDEEVYPYACAYFPQAILDWVIERNEYGRLTLTYVKLFQLDGTYILWYQDHFEIWEIPLDEEGNELESTHEATLKESTAHTLGEIPFMWIINKKWKVPPIGKSDISDIARIDVSIIRNLSQGEEIVDYSAFPMMRKPFQEGRPDQQVDKDDDVGVTAVLEFDADNPESKPDWLESEADGPLDAIVKWIQNKVSEIYRASNIGGMAATEVQTQAKSGVALQTEFQMLNSSLVRKAISLEKAERMIYKFWYLWEYPDQADEYYKETTVERDRTYDVENLAQDLDNIITSKTIVLSDKFNEAMQKKAARMMLPSWTDAQLKEIDEEIEESVEEEVEAKEALKEGEVNPFPEEDEDGNPIEEDEDGKTIPFQKKASAE